MNSLYLVKYSDSIARFGEGHRLFSGSSYSVKVDAKEFRADTEAAAELSLVSGDETLATCTLSPDTLRRGLRTGTLEVPADLGSRSTFSIVIRLGGNVIFVMEIGVDSVTPSGTVTPASPRWTVVDLGTVTSGMITVFDMTQTKLVAAAMDEPLSITPVEPSGSLDAYVVVSSETAGRFPFSEVHVGGASPVWSHLDSLSMTATRWIIRITKVADVFYADLRIGRPGGVETDPDGAVVTSAEVNR